MPFSLEKSKLSLRFPLLLTFLSVSVCLLSATCLYICLPVCTSVFQSTYYLPAASISAYLLYSVCKPLRLPATINIDIPACLYVYLPTYKSPFKTIFFSACHYMYQPACVSAHLYVCLSACTFACTSGCLAASKSVCFYLRL
jgi:hypothetical protein